MALAVFLHHITACDLQCSNDEDDDDDDDDCVKNAIRDFFNFYNLITARQTVSNTVHSSGQGVIMYKSLATH